MFVYLGAMQSLVCKTDVFMLLLFNVYKCGFLNSMSLFLSFFNFFFFFNGPKLFHSFYDLGWSTVSFINKTTKAIWCFYCPVYCHRKSFCFVVKKKDRSLNLTNCGTSTFEAFSTQHSTQWVWHTVRHWTLMSAQ